MSEEAMSISEQLRVAMAEHAAKGRIAIAGPEAPTSYAQLGTMIGSFADGFRRWGAKRGDFVGICASKSVEAVALYFGAMQAGCCPSFIEGSLNPAAIADQMNSVGMRHLVCEDAALVERNKLIADGGATLCHASELMHGGNFIDAELGAGDRAMLLFTSGSTGKPKGVLLSHGALQCNAKGVIALTDLRASDRLLHVMPLYHTNGINNQLIVPFLVGASIVLLPRFRADDAVQALRDWQPTYMTGVPTIYARMLPFVQPGETFPGLRFLRCGSAPITRVLQEEIEDRFGVPLIISYGLSEATCTSTMNPPAARRIGSIGKVLPGQIVALFVPGGDTQVPPGAEGEIRISGPALMEGYLGGAEQPIIDGWLRTGDLGQFDEDGYLAITGRIKDVIIRGGENISPALVESKIALGAGVRDCCVLGRPDTDLGEIPIAFVVLDDGAVADADGLKDLVRAKLSRSYVPAEIHFVEQLPLNPVGKIDRKALRNLLHKQAAAVGDG